MGWEADRQDKAPRTNLDDTVPCSMCGDAVSCLDTEGVADERELFAVECECGVRGPFCKTPAGAVASWNRMHSQIRTRCAHQNDSPCMLCSAVLAARDHLGDARREILNMDDDAAGAHAEDASRALALHKQLDPLRDACDSVNLACDNTIVGWQGMAEQAVTEAIAALEAWLEANK